MSFKSVKSNDSVSQKCGEIIITMKKNAKNVYSFNCWFCDTICVQMKKFTLHLEQEHITQLEQATAIVTDTNNEDNLDDKSDIQKEPAIDSIFVGEIKIEDCFNDDGNIKSEIEEEKSQIVTRFHKKDQLMQNSQDPLEAFESNANEDFLPVSLENDNEIFKIDNTHLKDESQFENVEMNMLSDDEQLENNSDVSENDNDSDSDFKMKCSSDENLIEPLKYNRNDKEKDYILALIEAYNQKPQLWNTLLPKCNNVQREMLFQNITDELNQKLKRNLKLYTIKNKIKDICKKYEKEIKRQLEAGDKNIETNNTELWFYENMNFLKTTIESKLKQKRKKTYHKVKPLSDDLLCEIIDVYKTYSSLWNVNHVAYPIKQKRDESLQSMVDDVKKKIDIPLDVDKLEKQLLHIHNSFSKDKEVKLKCEAKHVGFRPTCSFYNKCDFLEEHQGPFKCPYCSEIHMQYKDFQIHKSQHDGSIPFKCQECGMGFKANGNYTLHVKRHLGVFRYRCNICGKGYPLNSELTLHMRSHTGAQPYLCSICGEGFRAAIGYDNHMRRHEERFRYHCQICKRGFNVLATLRDHVNAHLNVRNFVCKDCGKSFTSKKYLQYHSRIHGSKNYTCNICGKSYAQDAGLRQHKRHMHATRIPKS
ncbi:zinc finger protein 267-like [Lucilia sericata]|uniref:zinc finger protein 267-like n=1 Tax=Lucilia sericata TaxID=13632 RepID=UPI0018A86F20|nr:zinc finger protein 267-like [Lucilia sericata]